jgi:hypothetical protein
MLPMMPPGLEDRPNVCRDKQLNEPPKRRPKMHLKEKIKMRAKDRLKGRLKVLQRHH